MSMIALPKRGENKYETDWSRWARNLANDGPILGELDGLAVEGYAGGMQVRVRAGTASVRGFYFHSSEEMILPIEAANENNDRLDCVVLRMDISANAIDANADPVRLMVLKGSPAEEPECPSLMKNDTVFDVMLATILIPSGASTIRAEYVQDQRIFSNVTNFSIHFFVPLVEIGICPTILKVPVDCEVLGWEVVHPFGQTGNCELALRSSFDLENDVVLGSMLVIDAMKAEGKLNEESLIKNQYLFVDVINFAGVESTNLMLHCQKMRG